MNDALAALAQKAIEAGDWATAAQALTTLLEHQKPPTASLLYNIGLAHRRAGSNLLALDWFDRALAADPTHHNALFEQACARQDLLRFAEAIDDFERYLLACPQDGDAILNLAQCRMATGQLAAAEAGLQALAESGDADAAVLRLRLKAERAAPELLEDAQRLMLHEPQRRADILSQLTHASRGQLPIRPDRLLVRKS